MQAPFSLFFRFYPDDTPLRRLLLLHSNQVLHKALVVCRAHPELYADVSLVRAGALLHDVGIFRCDAPGIHCHGKAHYLLHGLEGGSLLREAGEPVLARFCERHTGTGLTPEAFRAKGLPLPQCFLSPDADPLALTPQTIEEQIVCYADKFFSKSHPERQRTAEQTAQSLRKLGDATVETFLRWHARFGSTSD